MRDLIKRLCGSCGVSGDEDGVRELILEEIGPHACEVRVDDIGNILAYKKGRSAEKTILVDAHMDEVGIMVTDVTDEGLLRFGFVGGVDARVVVGRRVMIKGEIPGVIGMRPVHLKKDSKEDPPSVKNLFIDVGATDKEDALGAVSPGDWGVFDSDVVEFGDGFIKARALDNRVGCASAIKAMREANPAYDTVFVFTALEEVGLKGAYGAAHRVNPDLAIVVDTTTAADFSGVSPERVSSRLGGGPVIFFMETSAMYGEREISFARETADRNGIKWQNKNTITGGLDAGAIQRTRDGIPVVSVATPCRYIHTAGSVIKISDAEGTARLLTALVTESDRYF